MLQGTEEPSDCYGTPQEFRNSPPSPQLSFSARGRENPRIALTALGSELPEDELFAGAVEAARGGVDVVYLGTKTDDAMTCLSAADEGAARAEMERLIAGGEVDGAVTMHHPFPIGVSTVGRSVVNGRRLYLATTTGTASTDRVEGMVKSAVYGIAAAKACGVETPTVGILNIDGARSAEGALKALRQNGYPIQFAQSGRADGGCIMRGNDVLAGSCDVLVTDPLTGNVLSKMLAAAATGGLVEDTGDGYGPGIGIGYDRLILILSRASGRGVVAGALNYAGELARGNLLQVAAAELAAAQRAGLDTVLSRRKRGDSSPACLLGTQAAEPSDCYGTPKEFRNSPPSPQLPEAAAPPTEPTTAEIHGIEIMELDDAVQALWKAGIYAASGMGCTGPVVMVNEAREAQARGIMLAAGFLSE